jgi:hypothetical protein
MGKRRRRRDHGPGREFIEEGKMLVPLLAPGAADVVRIRIPRSHPQAAQLVELAQLCAARQKLLPSGMVIQHADAPQDGTDRMLALLKEMGFPVERIVADLAAGAAKRTPADDKLLKASLGLIGAATGIAGKPDAGKKLADALGTMLKK